MINEEKNRRGQNGVVVGRQIETVSYQSSREMEHATFIQVFSKRPTKHIIAHIHKHDCIELYMHTQSQIKPSNDKNPFTTQSE